MKILYIDKDQELRDWCATLQNVEWLALDTEFMREKTYYPQLCLIQIATTDTAACIDPLAIRDLEPLLDVLYRPEILKILHAARQDLEIFYNLRGHPPAPVHDTMLAATLLGHGDQVGYGALVKATLGIELAKAHSRTDWSRRPLSKEQIDYAIDDVRYLVQVYEKQLAELNARGRLDWLADDFAELSDARLYENPHGEAWQRIKGANFLRGVQLSVLQQLAAWREQQAQKSDRPRRWILKDEVLFDMAKMMPQNTDQLGSIRGLEKSTVERHGKKLLELIDAGKQLPREAWPRQEIPPRLSDNEEVLLDILSAVLRRRAREQQISPATLAPRREMEKFLRGDPESSLCHGWRARLAGDELQALLRGELQLQIRDGQLDITTTRASSA